MFSKSIQPSILLLLFFITGCSSLPPQNKSTARFDSYKSAIDSLSISMNGYIQQEMQANRLPEVLDVYVEDFIESRTNNKIDYGTKLRKDFKVGMSEQRRLLKSKKPELQSNIIFYFSDEKENKVYTMSGDFYQVDENWVQINVNLYHTSQKQILTGLTARFPLSDLEPDYFKNFASQVDIRFQAFKTQLKKYSMLTFNEALVQGWDPLYTANHRKEAGLLVEEIILKDIEDIFKDVLTISDIDKKVRMIEFLLRPSIYFDFLDYSYALKEHVARKFIQRKMELWTLKNLLKTGIETILSFVATSSSNEPLNFNCSGIVHNKTIDLTINSKNFISEVGSCSTEEEKQIMSWRKPFLLETGSSIPVWVTERNVISRNVTI
ncbi:hypothetical protein KKA14_09750, partial [bacterium]|nr:hypothetical protein [bacterium]